MRGIDPSRIRAICFDIDGTLADTDDQAVLFAGRMLTYPLRLLAPHHDAAVLARRLVMVVEGPINFAIDLADRLMLDEVVRPALEMFDRWRRGGSGTAPALIPGVEPLVQALSQRYALAIVTTRGDERTRRFLRDSRLERFFQAVITARSTRRTKPHAEPVLRAAAVLGVPVEACLIVGDTTVDIRSGRAAGAQTVGVLCGFGERQELERAGADSILTTTADLASLLSQP
jgi:HAD superfamily hydrolase (TIGR01509 family)